MFTSVSPVTHSAKSRIFRGGRTPAPLPVWVAGFCRVVGGIVARGRGVVNGNFLIFLPWRELPQRGKKFFSGVSGGYLKAGKNARERRRKIAAKARRKRAAARKKKKPPKRKK